MRLLCRSVFVSFVVSIAVSTVWATPLLKQPSMRSSEAIAHVLELSCEAKLEGDGVTAASDNADLRGDQPSDDYQGPHTDAAIVENIISAKTAPLRTGKTHLANGIDIPNGIFILFSKDVISGNKDEVLDLQSKFSKAWWVAMIAELDRHYRANITAHASNNSVGALAGGALAIIPHVKELFPYLHRVITDKTSADALPKDLKDILSGVKNVQLIDGRIPFRRAKELDRQVAQVLIDRRAAALHRDLQSFASQLILGIKKLSADGQTSTVIAPSITDLFLDASVNRDEMGRSTGEVLSWNTYLRVNSYDLVKNWYEDLVQLHLKKFVTTLATEFPISPYGHQLSDDFSLFVQQVQGLGAEASGTTDTEASPDKGRSTALVAVVKERLVPVLESIQVVVNRIAHATNIHELVGPAFIENGLAIHLPSIPATVRFNIAIGALEMGPLEVMPATLPGHAAATVESLDGDEVISSSGAGATTSTLASTRPQVPKFKSYGMKLRSIEVPDRGFGIQLRGHYIRYFEYFEKMFANLEARLEAVRPIRIFLGRSTGGIEVAELLILKPDSPVDVIVAQSTSLWQPGPAQLVGIYNQLRDGSITGIIKQALVDGDHFNNRGGALFETAQRLYPAAFEATGAEVLFWYGDDDDDYSDAAFLAAGLPTYPELMRQFRDRFFPLASLYPFFNRIKHLPQSRRLPQMMREGSHFILHNTHDYTLANLTHDERERMQGIPESLLPQLDSQTHEAIASLQMKKDILADGLPGGYDWPQAGTRVRQARLQQDRLRICGLHADGTPVTYLEHFILNNLNPVLKKSKKPLITMEKMNAATPGGETLLTRVARVHQWGQQEIQRLVQHLKSKGYLPSDAPEAWTQPFRLEGRSTP